MDDSLGFAEEAADEANVGGLHLGAGDQVGETLPESVALLRVFKKADLLENGEEVDFEVFEILGRDEIFVGFWAVF